MKLCQHVSVCLSIALLSATLSASALADSRTWKDATGAFSLDAELVEVSGGKVKLKKSDGTVVEVAISRLSAADQQFLKSASTGSSAPANVSLSQLSGKTVELKNDDGKSAGKKSFPRGIASAFEVDSDGYFLTSVKIYGSRYGSTRPPKEDFIVALCDKDFKPLTEFTFPYSRVERGNPKWLTLRVKPTQVPKDFVICLNFNPTATKGVYVHHDAEGTALVGKPNQRAGAFTGGDWMVRAVVDQAK